MRSSTSYRKGHVPWIKGKKFGSRTKSVKQKIIDGNIEYWRKQTEEFLAADPICAACFTELTNFSRLMLCDGCRIYYNTLAFKLRNPGYTTRYSRERRRKAKEKKLKEDLFPLTGLKERREKEALTAFYEEEREEKHELELEERRRKSAFCY